MKKDKRVHLIIIILWPIFASIFSFLLNASFIISMILFLVIPNIYLSLINRKFVKKLILYALTSIPLAIIVDNIMTRTGGWMLKNSIFSFRLFDYSTIEQIMWLFLYIYYVIIFYETFLDEHCKPRLYYPSLKYLIIVWLIILGSFIALNLVNPELLNIDYLYLKLGIILVIPFIIFGLLKYPLLYKRFFKANLYFFFVAFLYEITALKLNHWSFPSQDQFIGFITIFGVSFPFEEFLFWIILGGMATLVYYEIFDERHQNHYKE